MDRRVELAQQLFWEIKRLRELGERRLVTRKLRDMARLHEELARELLRRQDPDGWIDLYACITAWAEAGCTGEASQLIQYGRDTASLSPDGEVNINHQLDELDQWIGTLRTKVVPSLADFARPLPTPTVGAA